jgi:drug/metabolite transporter (DMT)-like permease
LLEPHIERRQRLTGIALMCGAVACFACLDSSAKFLGRDMSVIQVVWARYAGAFVLAFVLSNPLSHPGLMRTTRPALQIGRSLALLASSFLNFLALRYLQLDQALAITFSTPFLVAVLAGPVLGEWVGARRWAAIGVGFLGVLVVARPGFGSVHPAALLSLSAAFTLAFYNVTTRLLARTDSSETTLFYSNVIGFIGSTPMLPFVWTPPTSTIDIVLMVAVGAFGALGHYLLIVAHRFTPASALSPFMYTQLLWAASLGYLVFHDVPNQWTLAGAGIVVGSGLYLLHRERIRSGG